MEEQNEKQPGWLKRLSGVFWNPMERMVLSSMVTITKCIFAAAKQHILDGERALHHRAPELPEVPLLAGYRIAVNTDA
jgi:hypothetical protein